MKLTFEQIRSITNGAVRINEDETGIRFYRFTEAQEALYQQKNKDFYAKTFATAGIKLQFQTNSEDLFLDVTVASGSSRRYFAFDVFVNGKYLDCLDNFSDLQLPKLFWNVDCPQGRVQKEFCLGTGEKEVTVYFPWSAVTVLHELRLTDGATLTAPPERPKLLAFGDSITQGYDALHPSNRYIAKVAHGLGMEEVNLAIGGERFFPALAAAKVPFTPSVITVAYGTNDWGGSSKAMFEADCADFYERLGETYPTAKIFAITPIWRGSYQDITACGTFAAVADHITRVANALPNVTVIHGFDFVPKSSDYFADGHLHPNDAGFTHYAKGLLTELKKYC